MARTMDMTRGRPLPLMASFAVPLMAGNVCQLLYSVADSAVVGRVLGVQAFAAVGAASFYSWLVMDIVLGSAGRTVPPFAGRRPCWCC